MAGTVSITCPFCQPTFAEYLLWVAAGSAGRPSLDFWMSSYCGAQSVLAVVTFDPEL